MAFYKDKNYTTIRTVTGDRKVSEVTRYLNKEVDVSNHVLSQNLYIENGMELWDNNSKKLFDSKDNISVKTYEYDAFQKTTKITVAFQKITKITVTSQKETSIQENFYDAEGLRYAVRL